MKSNTVFKIIIAATLVNLSACSYIKSLFPDKEKDYQFTTEIKPLVLPSDLSDNPILKEAGVATAEAGAPKESLDPAAQNIEEASGKPDPSAAEPEAPSEAAPIAAPTPEPDAKPAEAVQAEAEPQSAKSSQPDSEVQQASESAQAATETQAAEMKAVESGPAVETTPSVEQSAKKQSEKVPVQMVIYDDGESRLRIGADSVKAWRLVGKALSRRSIEVISRMQEDLSFIVNYDPDEKKVEDESFWDEITFLFGGSQTNEKEYHLKLIANNQQTDVAVLDHDGNPASDGGALRLLKLIQKTLTAD